MIIEGLLEVIYRLLDMLLVFELPGLPAEVLSTVNTMFDYLVAGSGLLANYTNLGYLLILFGVILAIDAGIMIYHLVMWILKKIPVLGIS